MVVQIAGDALRMDLDVLEQELSLDSPLRCISAVVSNRVSHADDVFGRLQHGASGATALLPLAADDGRSRRRGRAFGHAEFLGMVLGVRQAIATEVLRPLNRMGLVRNNRHSITILDRGGLEKLACHCYRRVRNEFERLLPLNGGSDSMTGRTEMNRRESWIASPAGFARSVPTGDAVAPPARGSI